MLKLILANCVTVALFVGCLLLSPKMSAFECFLSGGLAGVVSGILVRWAKDE
jgi:hypothetical protein